MIQRVLRTWITLLAVEQSLKQAACTPSIASKSTCPEDATHTYTYYASFNLTVVGLNTTRLNQFGAALGAKLNEIVPGLKLDSTQVIASSAVATSTPSKGALLPVSIYSLTNAYAYAFCSTWDPASFSTLLAPFLSPIPSAYIIFSSLLVVKESVTVDSKCPTSTGTSLYKASFYVNVTLSAALLSNAAAFKDPNLVTGLQQTFRGLMSLPTGTTLTPQIQPKPYGLQIPVSIQSFDGKTAMSVCAKYSQTSFSYALSIVLGQQSVQIPPSDIHFSLLTVDVYTPTLKPTMRPTLKATSKSAGSEAAGLSLRSLIISILVVACTVL